MRTTITILLSFSLLLIFSASCSKGQSTTTYESRLSATNWTVKEVKYSQTGSMWYKDVTKNFAEYEFEFQFDYTLIITDHEDGLEYLGYWYIDEELSWDEEDQENDVTQRLVMTVYHPDTGEARDFNWTDLNISSSKIKAEEKRNGGKYKFHLVN